MEIGGVQQVLFNISFDVHAGEFVAIMGPSGSGKSTCMNIVGALDTPSGGTYELYGRNITNLGPDELAVIRNEHIGFVFQQFNLLSKRTVLDNVMLPLMYRGLPMAERERRAREMLRRVGLEKFESYLPTQLSGGMKQRVAIARALAGDPKLILADEPTGNLDEDTANEIIAIFSDLVHKKNKCVIMVTHSKELAQKADVILTLKKGSIVGTEDTVLDEKIRGALLEKVEGLSAPDDLRDKIMQEIEKQKNS